MSTISILNPSSGTENSKVIEVKTDSTKAVSVYPMTLLGEGTNEEGLETEIEAIDPIVCGFYVNITGELGEEPGSTYLYAYKTDNINEDPGDFNLWTDISWTVFGAESLELKPEGYDLPSSVTIAIPPQIPAVKYMIVSTFSGLGSQSTLEIFALTTS